MKADKNFETCDLILDLPFKGGKLIAVSKDDLTVLEIPDSARHSVSLLGSIADLCPRLADVRNIFINTGPGNFSSLRVVIISVLGLAAGHGIQKDCINGFSSLDVSAYNSGLSGEFSVYAPDGRGGLIGSRYDRGGEMNILCPVLRTDPGSLERSADRYIIEEDFRTLSTEDIVNYVYSDSYARRDVMSPVYYQKSYFETKVF